MNATAYWHPAGVFGLVYWYALVPAPVPVPRLTREIHSGSRRGDARIRIGSVGVLA